MVVVHNKDGCCLWDVNWHSIKICFLNIVLLKINFHIIIKNVS